MNYQEHNKDVETPKIMGIYHSHTCLIGRFFLKNLQECAGMHAGCGLAFLGTMRRRLPVSCRGEDLCHSFVMVADR